MELSPRPNTGGYGAPFHAPYPRRIARRSGLKPSTLLCHFIDAVAAQDMA